MPTAWLPCPGKVNAMVIRSGCAVRRAIRPLSLFGETVSRRPAIKDVKTREEPILALIVAVESGAGSTEMPIAKMPLSANSICARRRMFGPRPA